MSKIYQEQENLGNIEILEIIKSLNGDVKFYQASSSEMFGKSVDSDNYQRESTKMIPVSPYGCAKLFAYNITRHYREAYNLFAANGILFNHESPRRASNFVTSKVIKTAVQIKFGQASKLTLGNLDSQRDWGHSRDYVKAMVKILEHNVADDWVVATGETRSIRQLVELVFSRLDLNYKDYVIQDTKFMRPEELQYLRGDASKIKNELGWQPETSFEEMIDEMNNQSINHSLLYVVIIIIYRSGLSHPLCQDECIECHCCGQTASSHHRSHWTAAGVPS